MAQNNAPKNDAIENIEESLSNAELFIEKNQKKLLLVLTAIVVVVGGVLAYNQFIVKPKEAEAQTAMFRAEIYFEKDSFNLALNGKGDVEGFLSIIDNYGGTKSSNLAHYYAGICYLQTGKFQEGILHYTTLCVLYRAHVKCHTSATIISRLFLCDIFTLMEEEIHNKFGEAEKKRCILRNFWKRNSK